jgi:hypothetical protein
MKRQKRKGKTEMDVKKRGHNTVQKGKKKALTQPLPPQHRYVTHL